MENKINIAELLRDCSTGMELDCLMYDNLYFKCIREHAIYPIVCYTIDSKGEKEEITFSWYGKYALTDTAKCVIFPKGKTTWEGFHRPFKDGDIIYNRLQKKICIYYLCGDEVPRIKGCRYNESNTQLQFEKLEYSIPIAIQDYRLATEEEKQKLFQVIKDNGYEWNNEAKTLEKLVEPRFPIGAWVVFNNQPEKGSIYQIKNTHNYEYTLQHILGGSMFVSFNKADILRLWTINDAKDGDVLVDKYNNIGIFQECEGMCWHSYVYLGRDGKLRGFSIGGSHEQTDTHPVTKEQRDLLFQKIKEAGYEWNTKIKTLEELVKPIFKAGNKVRNKNNHNIVFTITSIEEDYYGCGANKALWFADQDKYELVPDKFDITTLKPFDSRVLVRDSIYDEWKVSFWGV